MFLLNVDQYSKVSPLFEPLVIATMVLDSIQKDARGKVFVNDPVHPATAFIKTDFDSYRYFGGAEKNPIFMNQMKDYFVNTVQPKIMIVFSPTDAWKAVMDELFKEYDAFRVTRHLFQLNHEKFTTNEWRNRGLGDFNLQSAERENGFELTLRKDDEIVSRCASVFIGAGKAEIDIQTHENYRRQGLAGKIASVFIERCFEKGLEPHWSCWDYNTPSFQLALKLGFENHLNLQAHVVKFIP